MSLMILSEFPATGLGVGSFIVNVPNYGFLVGYTYKHTDSAENYFLQLGTEVGLIGLIFMFWLFYEIWRSARLGFRRLPARGPDRYLLIGLVSGLVAVFVNLFFHSYIGAFDAKYFIWLLIGLIAVFHIHGKEDSERAGKPRKASRVLAWLALGVLLLVHLWNSTHRLSIPEVTERFALDQNFGLYAEERDEQGRAFNWTEKVAGITVSNLRQELLIPVRAAHPGIEKYPVKLEVFRTDDRFGNMGKIVEVTLDSTEWTEISVPLAEYPEDRVSLKLVTDRVWQPSQALGVSDTRLLGVALGRTWFESASHLGEGYRAEQTLGKELWQGETGHEMFASGKCSLVFRVQSKAAALRVNFQGLQAGDEPPQVLVRLDGRLIGRVLLESEDWEPRVFFAGMESGEYVLEVEFINDYIDLDTGEDRNVYLGDVEVLVKEDGSPS
jgi:hypothetical protein